MSKEAPPPSSPPPSSKAQGVRGVGEPQLEVRCRDGSVQLLHLELEFSIGRSEGNLVIPDDPFLSGHHLRFVRRWGQVIVEDLGSTNGVFMALTDEVELREGDEIRIGNQLFRFEP